MIKTVKTQYGLVSGVPSDSEGITLYKGVPIGDTTSGEGRFVAPRPAKKWGGVKVCDTWPDRFLQETATHTPGNFWGDEFYFDKDFEPGNTENGLAVNIYAPETANDGKLPVFVYIHGGAFTGGYASEMEFNASHLALQDVVVVLLQYRLGGLGWLALPELSEESKRENGHYASGNYAILDLVHGLKWIRDNIRGFGGDHDKVTIAGQSAGAMAVTYLLSTPLAKGLFRAAIVQSGFNGFFKVGTGLGATYQTLKEAEARSEEGLEAIFGKRMSVADLRAIKTEDFLKPSPSGKLGTDGKPLSLLSELSHLAGNMIIDDYVFTKESVDLLNDKNLEGIQIMIGGTSDEATSLFDDFIHTLGITTDNIGEFLSGNYGEGCVNIYETETKEKAEAAFMRAQSDYSLQKYLHTAELTEKVSNHETYVYYFCQVPPGRNEKKYGAYHSAELWYMFDSLRKDKGQREWTASDYTMAKVMSTYWMNFVKTGNPNSPVTKVDGNALANWEPCTAANERSFMKLGNGTSKMSKNTAYPERDAYHRKQLLEHLIL